jgi:ketosteroid isomerase-like protein
MTVADVELVREAWDAWARGDMDALIDSYFDPEIVYDLTHFREWPDRTYRGHAGVRRGLSEWRDVWDSLEVGVDEILAAPDGRVVVLTWQRGRGRQSGLPMSFEWALIATVRDGRIVRADAYDDRSTALEAAGLRA